MQVQGAGTCPARHSSSARGHTMASTSASASFHPTETLLERAKYYSKAGEHLKARRFYHCYTVAFPSACRAFVSWAQMEKRTGEGSEAMDRARAVLKKGLELNPNSACLVQAWGLTELQCGNLLAAIMMLERAVRLEPKCEPVLRWQQVSAARQVVTARKTVGSRRNSSICSGCTSS